VGEKGLSMKKQFKTNFPSANTNDILFEDNFNHANLEKNNLQQISKT
jgi:hypothetical protein